MASTLTKTFKVVGKIKRSDVKVLIDSGTNHNFISEILVTKLDLEVCSTKGFGVIVRDDH